MASKLGLYNAALRLLGDAPLAALTDEVESRRLLDSVYDDAIKWCLEQGLFAFSLRSVRMSPDPNFTPLFNGPHVYLRPTDYLRTAGIWANATESIPLVAYIWEGTHLIANINQVYLRYVSSGTKYGFNLGAWTASFQSFVEAHLAMEICPRLTDSAAKFKMLHDLRHERMRDANNRNSMDNPARFIPPGQWAVARFTGTAGNIQSSLRGTLRGL